MDDCANPLFLSWIKDWWEQARERNTKGVLAYRSAYDSLKACPIRYEHPDELLALRGFGPKLCSRLKTQLETYCAENELPMPKRRRKQQQQQQQERGTGLELLEDDVPRPRAAAAARKRKAYVPALRQGGYGIVMALSSREAEERGWLTKTEIVELAQPHCDTSYTVKPPGKFYTAWDSVKTLLKHELVAERGGRPSKRYALTDEGWETANKLRQVALGEAPRERGGGGGGHAPEGGGGGAAVESEDSLIPDGTDEIPDVTPIVLPPGSFTVQLVLDVRERVAGQHAYMETELAKRGVSPVTTRSLSLGDVLWLAKCHDPQRLGAGEGDEVVLLDWIVERKRQDDLISSIKDGRFREQKFRLRRSGVRRVAYVVEDCGLDLQVQQRYEDAMHSAVAATEIGHGFFVRRTRSVDDTIAYLAQVTKRLQSHYAHRSLHVLPTSSLTVQNHLPLLRHLRAQQPLDSFSISYPAFAALTSKSDALTLRDVFLKMLLCTRGVTGERALEIQRRWPTPHRLVQAYAALDRDSPDDETARKRKRAMVSDALGQLPGSKRRVTKAISEKLAEAWADAE